MHAPPQGRAALNRSFGGTRAVGPGWLRVGQAGPGSSTARQSVITGP